MIENVNPVLGEPVKPSTPEAIKYDAADLLQQTIDQTVLFTTHNIVDYMTAFIKTRIDYTEDNETYRDIIDAMKKLEKRYEDNLNGKDNGQIDSNNSK